MQCEWGGIINRIIVLSGKSMHRTEEFESLVVLVVQCCPHPATYELLRTSHFSRLDFAILPHLVLD